MRLIKTIKDNYSLLLKFPAGSRFTQHHQIKKENNPIKSILMIIFGIISCAIAVIFIILPGPAIIFWIIALTFFSSQSMALAVLLDKGELLLRKILRYIYKYEPLQMCVVWAIAIGVDFGTYFMLMNFLPEIISKSIAFMCGASNAYFVNKFWQHKQKQPFNLKTFPFITASLFSTGLNTVTNHYVLTQWPGAEFLSFCIAAFISTCSMAVSVPFWALKR